MRFDSDWICHMLQAADKAKDEFQKELKKNCLETKQFYEILREMELEEY